MKAAVYLSLSLIVCTAVAGSSPRHGRGWRGIVPLHSTRADVERLLGHSGDSCRCLYDTPEGRVYVNYSKNRCEGYLPGWNVPADTVLAFTVYQKEWRAASGLGFDNSNYVVTYDDSMTAYYTDKEAGVSYTVSRGGGGKRGVLLAVNGRRGTPLRRFPVVRRCNDAVSTLRQLR